MKKIFKISSLILMMLVSNIFVFAGCGSVVDNISAQIDKSEITVYFEEADGIIEDTFSVALSGLSENMSTDLDFKFHDNEVANISRVGSSSTYKVTANKGGSSDVDVIHSTTNKKVGTIKINAVRKLQSIELNNKLIPYAVIGETTNINTSSFIILKPEGTTQKNIGYRLARNTQGVIVKENGSITIDETFNGTNFEVIAYSLDNESVQNLTFTVTAVRRPSAQSFEVYNLDNEAEVFFKNGEIVKDIELIKDYVDVKRLSTKVLNSNVSIEYSIEDEKYASFEYGETNSSVLIKSGLVGRTNLKIRASVLGFEGIVYNEISIPVIISNIPSEVRVNGISENQNLNIYTSYANNKGYELKLSVDLPDTENGGEEEICISLNKNYLAFNDYFDFYYSDGITKIDLVNDILPNNSTIYVIANKEKIQNISEKVVFDVYSYRANKVGVEVKTTLTLTGYIGITSLELLLDRDESDLDKTLYVEKDSIIYVPYKTNEGAYVDSLIFNAVNNELAEFSVNTITKEIEIKGQKEGKTTFVVTASNGQSSNILALQVFITPDKFILTTDSPLENSNVTKTEYANDNNSLSKLVILTAHGVTVDLSANGTIISKKFTTDSKYFSVSLSTGYVYGYASGAGSNVYCDVTYYVADGNRGNVVKRSLAESDKKLSFEVEVYVTVNSIGIYKYNESDDTTSVGKINSLTLYSKDIYMDREYYSQNKYYAILQVKTNPSNAAYDDIVWSIFENPNIRLEKVYLEDGITIDKTKIRVISENYNNFDNYLSANVTVTYIQYQNEVGEEISGKYYTSSCRIYTISEKPASIILSESSIYIDPRETTSFDLNSLVKTNDDATNKKINYSANTSSFTIDEKGVLTLVKSEITQKYFGGVYAVSIYSQSKVNYETDLASEIFHVEIIVADGRSTETAYRIYNQKQLISCLNNEDLDIENNNVNISGLHYVLMNDINLSNDDKLSYEYFYHVLSTYNDKTYSINNIVLTKNSTSLFGEFGYNASINNINFNFRDVIIYADQLNDNSYTIGALVGKIERLYNAHEFNEQVALNNVSVRVNNIVLNGTKSFESLYIGGVAGFAKGVDLKNVSFEGNIQINKNITATNSGVGGLVGKIVGLTRLIYDDVRNEVGEELVGISNVNYCYVHTSISVPSLNNVGGLIGSILNVNISNCIVDVYGNYDIEQGSTTYPYVYGNENVAGLVGNYENSLNLQTQIINSYVKAYKEYLIVKGTNNVAGFIANLTLNANLEIQKSYASIFVEADENKNASGFINTISLNSNTITITNSFCKGSVYAGNTKVNSFINKDKYFTEESEGVRSYFINLVKSYFIINEGYFNIFGENNTDISNVENGVELEDLTKIEIFDNTFGFEITSDLEELLNNHWFIGNGFNNNYPTLIIDGEIAEENITAEGLENALKNLDSLNTSDDINGLLKVGKLSDDTTYILMDLSKLAYGENSTNKVLGLENLFKITHCKLIYEIISGGEIAIIDSYNNLILTGEAVIELKVSLAKNPLVSKVIKMIFVDLPESIYFVNENGKNATTITTYVDLTAKFGVYYNKGENKNYSNLIYIGFDARNYNSNGNQIFSILNVTEYVIGGTPYYVSNMLDNSFTALNLTGSAEVTATLLVKVGQEFIVLNTESANPIQAKATFEVGDMAEDLNVSVSEITMSLMDEFDFDIEIVNAPRNDDLVVEIVNGENNLQYKQHSDLVAIRPTDSDATLASKGQILRVDSLEQSYNDKTYTEKFRIKFVSEFLTAENFELIDKIFDYNIIKIKISSNSNGMLYKYIDLKILRQDILKYTLEFYSNGQTEIRETANGETIQIYEPNEISTNLIVPGKFGLLAISLYPEFSDYDNIYIDAYGENGENVVLTQKVVWVKDDGSNKDKKFVTVKPNGLESENGIYLRKTSYVSSNVDLRDADKNLHYDGNIYVGVFISKATLANTKFTFKVTAYRNDINGNRDESTVISSKEFYLYAKEVPTISLDQTDSDYVNVELNKQVYSCIPVVKYTNIDNAKEYIKEIKVNLTNFGGNIECSVKDINKLGANSIRVTSSNSSIYIDAYNVTAGSLFEVTARIQKYVDGILLKDEISFNVLVVDYIIEDIYLSTSPKNKEFGEELNIYSKVYSRIYINVDIIGENNPYISDKTKYQEIANCISINGLIKTKDGSLKVNVDNFGNYYFEIKVETIRAFEDAIVLRLFYNYVFDASGNISFKITNDNTLKNCKQIIKFYNVNGLDNSTLEDAIPVKTAEEFVAMMESQNSNFVLLNDIDLTDYYGENTLLKPFNPKFRSLNGNNYVVTTYMPVNTLNSGSENIGFFGTILEDTIIRNLAINYVVTTDTYTLNLHEISNANIGLFAGGNNGTLFNCKASITKLNNENQTTEVIIDIVNDEQEYISPEHNVGGFVGTNLGNITNCNVGTFNINNINPSDNTKSKFSPTNFTITLSSNGTLSGFVGVNSGKISKSYATNVSLKSNLANNETESRISGFVGVNELNGKIQESYANSENRDGDGTIIQTNGYIGGFVNLNHGVIENSYVDVKVATPSRSAGFVFENDGTIKTSYTSAKVDNSLFNSTAYSPFTGTNELSEVLNDGLIEYCYYKSDKVNLIYQDEIFDEPAIGIDSLNAESMFGLYFGSSDENENNTVASSTGVWKVTGTNPTININPIKFESTIENIQNEITDPSQAESETAFVTYSNVGDYNNPEMIYSAERLLQVLTDLKYRTKTNIVNVHLQFACDIDMDEVANDSRLAEIQKLCFTGVIDGNGYSINNLSVLYTGSSVTKGETFGFFSQIGTDEEKITAVIKSLNINVKAMSNSEAIAVGVLAGVIENAVITNVILNGTDITVRGGNIVGALAGLAHGKYTTLTNISSNLSVTAGYSNYNGFANYADNQIDINGLISSSNYTYYKSIYQFYDEEYLKEYQNKYNEFFNDASNKETYNNESNSKVAAENEIWEIAESNYKEYYGKKAEKFSYAGGIVGVIDAYTTEEVEISVGGSIETITKVINNINNLIVQGDVEITGDIAGGILGYSHSGTYGLKFEMSTGINTQHIIGRYITGGLVAYNDNGVVENARIEVDSKNTKAYSDKLEDSKTDTLYSDLGSDSAMKTYSPFYIGGLVGYSNGGEIKYSYNTANVIHYNAKYVGGIVGYAKAITMNEIYFTGNVYAGNNYYNPKDETAIIDNEYLNNQTKDITLKSHNTAGAIFGVLSIGKKQQQQAGNLIETLDTTFSMLVSLANFDDRIDTNDILKEAIDFSLISYESNLLGQTKTQNKVNITINPNVFSFAGKLITVETNHEFSAYVYKYAEKMVNFGECEFVPDKSQTVNAKIDNYEVGDRNTKKENAKDIFNIGATDLSLTIKFSSSVWNNIDKSKNNYPTLKFLVDGSIRKIYSEYDLRKYLSTDSTSNRVYELMNDIYLTDYWNYQILFKDCAFISNEVKLKNAQKDAFTIYNINIYKPGENVNAFLSMAQNVTIKNVNFVFGSSINKSGNTIRYFDGGLGITYEKTNTNTIGGLIGNAKNVAFDNVNVEFASTNVMTYNCIPFTDEKEDGNVYVGAFIGKAEDISTTNLSINFINRNGDKYVNPTLNQSTMDISFSYKTGAIATKEVNHAYVGGLIGYLTSNYQTPFEINGFSINNSNNSLNLIINDQRAIKEGNAKEIYVGGMFGYTDVNINVNSTEVIKNQSQAKVQLISNDKEYNFGVNYQGIATTRYVGGVIGNLNNNASISLQNTDNRNGVFKINTKISQEESNTKNIYNNVGGFVGYANGMKLIGSQLEMKTEISNLSNMNEGGIGGFAGTMIGGSIQNVFVETTMKNIKGINSQNAQNTNSNVGIGGFVGIVEDGSISNSGTSGEMNISSGKIHSFGGFAGILNNYSYTTSRTINTFTLTNMNVAKDSTISYLGGYVGCVNTLDLQQNGSFSSVSINKSYSANKITSKSNKVEYIAGFAGYAKTASISNCYTASTLLDYNITDNDHMAGFANAANGLSMTACYYHFNALNVEHNGIATPTCASTIKTILVDKGYSDKYYDRIQYKFINTYYPTLGIENNSITGYALQSGGVLNPIALTANTTIEKGKSYYHDGSAITKEIDLQDNVVIIAEKNNTNPQITFKNGNVASNYYIAGFTVVSSDSTSNSYGFIDVNNGTIFNCNAIGTIYANDNSILNGFVNTNNGFINYSGSILTYRLQDKEVSVNGFVKDNKGQIARCFTIANVTDYALENENSTKLNEDLIFSGFAYDNAYNNNGTIINGTIINSYSAFASTSGNNTYPFIANNVGNCENNLFDKNAITYENDDEENNICYVKGATGITYTQFRESGKMTVNSNIWTHNQSFNYGYRVLKNYNENHITLLGYYFYPFSYVQVETGIPNIYNEDTSKILQIPSASLFDYYFSSSYYDKGNGYLKYANLTNNIDLGTLKKSNPNYQSAYGHYSDNGSCNELKIWGNNYTIINANDVLFTKTGDCYFYDLGIVSTITNSTQTYVGAYVGRVFGYAKFTNCWANVNITTSGVEVGGFVGHASDSEIYSCFAYGEINASKATYLGGIVGYIWTWGRFSAENSYSLVTLKTHGLHTGNSWFGSFAGYANRSSSLTNCYASPAMNLIELNQAFGKTSDVTVSELTLGDTIGDTGDTTNNVLTSKTDTYPYLTGIAENSKFACSIWGIGEDATAGISPLKPCQVTNATEFTDAVNESSIKYIAVAGDISEVGTYGTDNPISNRHIYGLNESCQISGSSIIFSKIKDSAIYGLEFASSTFADNGENLIVYNCKATGSLSDPSYGRSYFGGFINETSENIDFVHCNNEQSITANLTSTGGFVGWSNADISMYNCKLLGSVQGTYRVGGFIGYNKGTATISGCTISGEVKISIEGTVRGSPTVYVGGFIGYNASTATISGCTTSGNVEISITGTVEGSPTVYVGGFIGYNEGTATISGCTTSRNVKISITGTVGGIRTVYVGGFIGYNYGTATIENKCTTSGTVTGGNYSDVGGFIGYNKGTATISGCTTSETGTVTGGISSNVGGFIGYNASTATISGCTTSGTIKSGDSSNIGGLVGFNNGTTSVSSITVYFTEFDAGGSESSAGGLVGYNYGTLQQTRNITVNFHKNVTRNESTAGTLVGNNDGTIKLDTGFDLYISVPPYLKYADEDQCYEEKILVRDKESLETEQETDRCKIGNQHYVYNIKGYYYSYYDPYNTSNHTSYNLIGGGTEELYDQKGEKINYLGS